MNEIEILDYAFILRDGLDWVSVLQSLIGTFAGFGLGLVAFTIQSRLQQKANEKKEQENSIDALKRLLTSAQTNIETMALWKLSFVGELEPEVKRVQPLIDGAFKNYDTIPVLGKELEGLQNFFITWPKTRSLPPPSFSELARISDIMPGLSLFIHRAETTVEELGDICDHRNFLIAEYARENAGGVNSHRLLYFASMIGGTSKGLCEKTDDAIAFYSLALEQAENYLRHRAGLSDSRTYQFTEEVKKCLPEEDRFPHLRQQFVDFRNK